MGSSMSSWILLVPKQGKFPCFKEPDPFGIVFLPHILRHEHDSKVSAEGLSFCDGGHCSPLSWACHNAQCAFVASLHNASQLTLLFLCSWVVNVRVLALYHFPYHLGFHWEDITKFCEIRLHVLAEITGVECSLSTCRLGEDRKPGHLAIVCNKVERLK